MRGQCLLGPFPFTLYRQPPVRSRIFSDKSQEHMRAVLSPEIKKWMHANFASVFFSGPVRRVQGCKRQISPSLNIHFALRSQEIGLALTVQEQTRHKLVALRIGQGQHLERAHLLQLIICFQNITRL